MRSGIRIQSSELRIAITTGLLIMLLQWNGQAQDVIFHGDPQPIGARGTALGGSLVSDLHDIEGLYNNPASLRALAFPGLTTDHRHDWDQGIFFDAIALRAFSTDFHSLGVGLRLTDAGTFGAKRLLEFRQYAADVGYAIDVFSNLSVGLLAGAREGKASGESKSGYSFSFGLLYAPTPAVTYGIVLRDLGKSLSYSYSSVTEKTAIALGAFRPASAEIGSSLLFPTNGREPFLQLSVSVERDYIVKELRYRGGIEITPWHFLAARVGYINATVTQATGGLGLTIGKFRFDYAIMPRPQAPRYDEFSIKAFF